MEQQRRFPFWLNADSLRICIGVKLRNVSLQEMEVVAQFEKKNKDEGLKKIELD